MKCLAKVINKTGWDMTPYELAQAIENQRLNRLRWIDDLMFYLDEDEEPTDATDDNRG